MRASLSDSLIETRTGTVGFDPDFNTESSGDVAQGLVLPGTGARARNGDPEVEDPFKGSPVRSTGPRVNGHPLELHGRDGDGDRPRGMSFAPGPPLSYYYPPASNGNGDGDQHAIVGQADKVQHSAKSSSSSTPRVATATIATTAKVGQEDPIRIPASLSPPSPPHPLSLSHYLAGHPEATVKKALRKTYPKPNPLIRLARRFKVRHSVIHGLTDKEMQKLEDREGKLKRDQAGWRLEHEPDVGADGRPRVIVSPLFWKVYLSILPTLERDPLSGLVPPPLLGSTTTMPLSVISLIPDIMRHYRDVIVRAEREVFLVTNYWQ